VLLACTVAGCGATTQEAERAVEATWLGRPSDAFFSRYGAPQSSFPLNNGGTLYRWRGGDQTINVAPQFRTIPTPGLPGMQADRSTTVTHTSHPDANTTVTTSSSRGLSIGFGMPLAQQVLVAPAQTIQVFCEAEITTDPQGVIRHIHATQDTRGAFMGISRCAEVFNVR
jgi:hypothetical protein